MPVMQSEVLVQSATQSVLLTGVAPALLLRGLEEFNLTSVPDIEVLSDLTQGLSGGDAAVVQGMSGKASFSGWCTYQHLGYFLDNLLGQATPSGAGPYTRNYAAPINSAPAPRIMSLYKGDVTVGGYRMVGSLLSGLTLKLMPKKSLAMSGDFVGVVVEPQAMSGVLSKPSITPILASQVSSLKLDTFAGTMGATTLTNCTLRNYELTLTPSRDIRTCVGAVTGASYVEMPWTGRLKVSLEYNTTTKADLDTFVAGTLLQKQFEVNLASGTNSLKLQFAGTVQNDVQIFGDDDGVTVVEFDMERTYQSTFGNWFKAVLVNSVSGAQML